MFLAMYWRPLPHFLSSGIFAISVLLFSVLAFAQEAPQRFVAIPALGQMKPLRVLVANSERFQAISPEFLEKVLVATKAIASRNFSIKLAFASADFTTLAQAMSRVSASQRTWALSQSLDLSRPEDIEVLRKGLAAEIYRNGGSSADVRAFAGKYLSQAPQGGSEAAFVQALAQTQVDLMADWKSLKLADGKPLLNNDGLNEYFIWMVLGYTNLPYEIVITNQPIASAERMGGSVHSALRGGVTNGLTSSSRSSMSGAFSVLSVFPFVSNDAVTLKLRNGKSYGADEAAKYAGAILAHEIGHQLLHLGHPFDNPACLMRPPIRLHFDEWFLALDPAKCAVGSSASMTPGKAVQYTDIRQ